MSPRTLSIALPSDVAQNVLVELQMHRSRLVEAAAEPNLQPDTRELREKHRDEAVAAAKAYSDAYFAACSAPRK